jgi:prophage antirepressor-like protein
MAQKISVNTSVIFDTDNVRIVGTYEEPWFIAKDICKKLGLINTAMAMKKIPEKWRGSIRLTTSHGEQTCNIVNEAGLYNLVMRCDKPEAQKFREWICEDVLPSLRKKGKYELDQEIQKKLSDQEAELKKLNRLLKRRERRQFRKKQCIYIVKNPDVEGKLKIGKTKDMNRRLDDYCGSSPNEHSVLFHRYVPDPATATAVENTILFIFDKYRCETDIKDTKKREWLELDLDTIKAEIDAVTDFIISRRKIHETDYDFSTDEDKEENASDSDPEKEPTKTCTECEETNVLTAFYEREENKDGYENLCKKCYVKRLLKARKNREDPIVDTDCETKTCKKCQEVLPKCLFRKHCTSKDGYVATCNNCYCPPPVAGRTEKICSLCKILKSITEYNNCRTSADGKFAYCRPCNILKNKQYRQKNT